jgi:hypothetical protein
LRPKLTIAFSLEVSVYAIESAVDVRVGNTLL